MIKKKESEKERNRYKTKTTGASLSFLSSQGTEVNILSISYTSVVSPQGRKKKKKKKQKKKNIRKRKRIKIKKGSGARVGPLHDMCEPVTGPVSEVMDWGSRGILHVCKSRCQYDNIHSYLLHFSDTRNQPPPPPTHSTRREHIVHICKFCRSMPFFSWYLDMQRCINVMTFHRR